MAPRKKAAAAAPVNALAARKAREQAEALALEVDSWKLSYGMWEEKPAKVIAAAQALRRRDMARATPVKALPSQGIYDVLVAESRQLMAAGQFDQAFGLVLRERQQTLALPGAQDDDLGDFRHAHLSSGPSPGRR